MTVTVSGGITFSGGLTFAPGGAAANDPYFMYNSLLLPGNGTNLAQNNTFLDGSTNNFAITRNGNTTQGTFSPYGANWSNYFDGSTSYLTTASSSASAGNFTMEAWIYRTAATLGVVIGYGSESTGRTFMYITSGGGLAVDIYNVGGTTFGGSIPINQWTHIAIVRSTNVITGYINGTAQATTTSSAVTIGNANGFGVGAGNDGSNKFTGYISNARVVVGVAVYTSAFTPSTTPLTAIAGTSLLTSQSNRFIDNSTNAFAITRNGNTNIQRFSPFAPSAAYSTSTIGGSGYFDGTGDYLTAPSNAAFAFGTGAYTVEAWIYLTAFDSFESIIFGSGSTAGGFGFTAAETGALRVSKYGTGTIATTSTGIVTLNQWYYVAVSRASTASNNTKFFLNGALVTTTTDAENWTISSAPIIGGWSNLSSYDIYGYITDVRVVKGTAVYTTAFTPPSAPLTAITNTSLLLNYTNGGIIDNAMMNNLETVGNAQISTVQSKFGGSSMLFDGTGDYLTAPNTVNANFNNGDFTVEFWMYASSQALAPIVHQTSLANNQGWIIWNYTGDNVGTVTRKLTFMANGAAFVLTTSSDAYTDNTWTHIAIVKNGTGSNNIKIYSNGTSIATGTYATALANPSTPLMVGGIINGQSWNGTSYFNGYLDDLRITKGYARYTSNFTPPTAALPTY